MVLLGLRAKVMCIIECSGTGLLALYSIEIINVVFILAVLMSSLRSVVFVPRNNALGSCYFYGDEVTIAIPLCIA